MLTWETVEVRAELDGYTYTIRNVPDDWVVVISGPDREEVVEEMCPTLEEAKGYCERTAEELSRPQADEGWPPISG